MARPIRQGHGRACTEGGGLCRAWTLGQQNQSYRCHKCQLQVRLFVHINTGGELCSDLLAPCGPGAFPGPDSMHPRDRGHYPPVGDGRGRLCAHVVIRDISSRRTLRPSPRDALAPRWTRRQDYFFGKRKPRSRRGQVLERKRPQRGSDLCVANVDVRIVTGAWLREDLPRRSSGGYFCGGGSLTCDDTE